MGQLIILCLDTVGQKDRSIRPAEVLHYSKLEMGKQDKYCKEQWRAVQKNQENATRGPKKPSAGLRLRISQLSRYGLWQDNFSCCGNTDSWSVKAKINREGVGGDAVSHANVVLGNHKHTHPTTLVTSATREAEVKGSKEHDGADTHEACRQWQDQWNRAFEHSRERPAFGHKKPSWEGPKEAHSTHEWRPRHNIQKYRSQGQTTAGRTAFVLKEEAEGREIALHNKQAAVWR